VERIVRSIHGITDTYWIELAFVLLLALVLYPYIGVRGLAWLGVGMVAIGAVFCRRRSGRWHLLPANAIFVAWGLGYLAFHGDPSIKSFAPLSDFLGVVSVLLLLAGLVSCIYTGIRWNHPWKSSEKLFLVFTAAGMIIVWRLTKLVDAELVQWFRYSPGRYSELVQDILVEPLLLGWLAPLLITAMVHFLVIIWRLAVRFVREGVSLSQTLMALRKIVHKAKIQSGGVDQTLLTQRCQGITRLGNRCRNPAMPGSRYCRVHSDQKARTRSMLPKSLADWHIRLDTVAISLVILTTLSAGMWAGAGWIRSNYFAVPYTRPDELSILVAPFIARVETRDVQERISKALERELASKNISNVRVHSLPKEIQVRDRKSAEGLAQKYGAALAIWGSYDESGFWGHVTPNPTLNLQSVDTELEKKFINTPEDFNVYINDSLQGEMSYFVDLAIGQLYMNDRQSELAREFFDRALELAHRHVITQGLDVLYVSRGNVNFDGMYDYEGAIIYYTRAIEINPSYSEAYYYRGEAYAQGIIGLENAVSDYSEAIKLKPDFAEAYLGRAEAYIWMSQEERHGAAVLGPLYELLESKPPPVPQTYWDQALSDLTKAVELRENDAGIYLERSALYYELERFNEVIADCDRAISILDAQRRNLMWRSEMEKRALLGGLYGKAYLQRGKAYLRKHNASQAFADFDQAIRIDPLPVEAYFYRGALYYTNGYRDEARKDLKEYLKHGEGPGHVTYEEQAQEMLKALEGNGSP
jgi:tetratricopeptide (TPR) repeat protein